MRGWFRRWIAGLFCVLSLLSIMTCQTAAISTSASSSALMDVESGRVLYQYRGNAQMKIASTTKIMTALVAIENGTLSNVVTIKKSETGIEGTSMYLKSGERLTLETLLYGLLLCSGNDAAVAIADHVGGSQKKFVAMMNNRAKELGMKNTSFANPNGLDDPHHYSSALDMAKLACAAMKNETLVRIVSTKSVVIGGRTMKNHNRLLSYMDGCIGLKTGYTKAAGRTLVSCAVKNGQKLVAVTLQDGNDWVDHEQLYEYGFATFPAKTVLTMGKSVKKLSVKGSFSADVPLIASDTVRWPAAKNEKLTVKLNVPKYLTAPTKVGAVVGQAIVLLNGKTVKRVDLLCGEDTLPELPDSMSLFHQLQDTLFE